jgi:hypothetical protein
MVQENQSTPQETEIGQDGGTEQNARQEIGNEETQENGTLEGDSDNEQSPDESSDDTEDIEGIEGTDESSEDEQSDTSELDIDESTRNPGLG